MLPPLRRYSLHAMSSAYRLIKPTSPVSCTVTRSFLTTISDHAPAKPKDKTVGEKKPAPRKKSDVAEKADRPTKSKAARPKIPKKDLVPPFRKPTSGFARFVKECMTNDKVSKDPKIAGFAAILPYACAEWAKFSEEDKKKYSVTQEELEAYKAAYKEWFDGLAPNMQRAVVKNRKVVYAREKGIATGYHSFLAEQWKLGGELVGEHKVSFGNRISEYAAKWNGFNSEEKEDWNKRAANARMARKATETTVAA